jgi:2,5-dihydroxypyridine 5,6-dioxygenase
VNPALFAGAMCVLGPNVNKGESVAIISSTDIDDAYYEALAAAAYTLGAETTIALMTPRTGYGRKPPEAISRHYAGVDVTVAAASTSISHTPQRSEYLARGGKWITFPTPPGAGRAIDELSRMAIYTKDVLYDLKDITLRYKAALTAASQARIQSEAGTDVTLDLVGHDADGYYGIAEPISDMIGSWPPSESHMAVNTAEGIIVVDGYITGVGLCDVPTKLTVTQGHVTEIAGGRTADKLRALLERSDENANVVSELGVGTNRHQSEQGTNGDKKVAGTVHVALGTTPMPSFAKDWPGKIISNVHVDMVLKAPVTLTLDGKPAVAEGALLL